MTPATDKAAPIPALLPCPFCGSPSDELMLFCDPDEGLDNSGPSRRIQCAGCNVEAPFYSTKAEAVEAWNRRADREARPSPPDSREERIKAEAVEDERGQAFVEMLMRDHERFKTAGNALAVAAIRVTTEYDGLHRLALATADWNKAVADEGDRARQGGNNG